MAPQPNSPSVTTFLVLATWVSAFFYWLLRRPRRRRRLLFVRPFVLRLLSVIPVLCHFIPFSSLARQFRPIFAGALATR